MKELLKKNKDLYAAAIFIKNFLKPVSRIGFFAAIGGYAGFLRDSARYFRMQNAEKFKPTDLCPVFGDKTGNIPVDPYYFYQDTWAAGKIIKDKPLLHVDVGSTLLFVGILSKITKVCGIDLRAFPLCLENLEFRKGDILNLPFRDGEVRSLSTLCVVEHIGLGRYGDALDPRGSEKAARELARVIGKGGSLYVSLPVGDVSKVHFNSHREFSVKDVLSMFSDLELAEAVFIVDKKVYNRDEYLKLRETADTEKMTVGCFHFRKK